jgi:hypothetical protein
VRGLKPKTVSEYKRYLDRMIYPTLGEIRLSPWVTEYPVGVQGQGWGYPQGCACGEVSVGGSAKFELDESSRVSTSQRRIAGSPWLAAAVAEERICGIAQLIAYRAAEQDMDRQPDRLAQQVPQRLVEPGDRAGEDDPMAIERPLGHDLPVVLDTEGVLPDQVLGQLMDSRPDRLGTPLAGRLPPPDQPARRLDTNEEPAWRDQNVSTRVIVSIAYPFVAPAVSRG